MSVVMDHRVDLGPGFIDFAVDHPLAVETEFGRLDRLGIEIELDDVGNLRQFRRAVARDEIAFRIVRMAHADMAEVIEHFLVGHDARRDDQFVQQFGYLLIRHGWLRFDVFPASFWAPVLASWRWSRQSMIPKSGDRFSDKIMRQRKIEIMIQFPRIGLCSRSMQWPFP